MNNFFNKLLDKYFRGNEDKYLTKPGYKQILRTRVEKGGEEYRVYKVGNNYFYKDNGSKKAMHKIDPKFYKSLSKNTAMVLDLDRPSQPRPQSKPQAKPQSRPSHNDNGGSGGGYGGGGYGGGGGTGSGYLEGIIGDLKKKIDELENPKVWTAAELAKLYGITDQYNYNNILNRNNKATNKYYDDAILEQNKINNDANMSSASYANMLVNKYLNSYENAAPTATGRGVLAANALSNNINADTTAGALATNLNNIVNNYREARKSELANNPILARQEYNQIGSWLLDKGAKLNASDVQQYVDTLNSYVDKYAAARNAQVTAAKNNASVYQNNAQAALANAGYNNSMKDYKYYQYWYGDEAPRAYANVLRDINTRNINK